MSRLAIYGPPLILAGLILIVCCASELQINDSRQAAAVFPPWWAASASLGGASKLGSIVGLGRLPFVVIVHASVVDISARARAAGAWFVVDGARFGLCSR